MTPDTKFWDKIAEKYAKHPIGDMEAYEQTLARVAHHLCASDHVVEIGCGTATTALRLAPDVARLTATDISGEMLRIAQDKAAAQGISNVDILQAQIDDPRLTNGSHDAVLAFSLLHLLPDLDQALRDVHRMLKPGGLFMSKTPCLAAMWYLRPLLPVMRWIGKAPTSIALLEADALGARIERAGFDVIETADYPAKAPPRRFIVARKREDT